MTTTLPARPRGDRPHGGLIRRRSRRTCWKFISTMPVDLSSSGELRCCELSCRGSLFLRQFAGAMAPFQTDYKSGYLSSWRRNRLTLVISTVCARLRDRRSFLSPECTIGTGGFVGVDIFFVISGFIVSRSFSAVQEKSFVDFVIHFYSRRLARMVPALTVCLLVSTLATVLFIPYAYLAVPVREQVSLPSLVSVILFSLPPPAIIFLRERSSTPSPTPGRWASKSSIICCFRFFLSYGCVDIGGFRAPCWRFCWWFRSVLPSRPCRRSSSCSYLIYYRFWELERGALLFQIAKDRTFMIPARTGVILSCIALVIALVTVSPGSTPYPGAILPVLGRSV